MKRFDIGTCCGGPAYLVGNPDGKYVKYEEVVSLETERDQLLAALERYLECDPTRSFGGDTPANQARAAIAKATGGAE